MSAPKRCSLKTTSFNDVASALPQKKPLDQEAMQFVDLFVVAKGFEERVVAVPQRLLEMGCLGAQTCILVGRYRTNAPDNEQRYAQLGPLLEQSSQQVDIFDAENPLETHLAVSRRIQLLQELIGTRSVHIAIDISGASSTLIFSLIATVFRHPANPKVTILYAEASTYFPQVDNPTQIELMPQNLVREEGTDGIERHELFRGHETTSRGNFIIGVPSYSFGRFEQCIYELGEEGAPSPNKVLALIIPNTTATNHQHHQSTISTYVRRIFAESAVNDSTSPHPRVIECDVQEYSHTVRTIMELADEKLGSNVYLVHFGPKLQSLGAALALLVRSEVCLVFARPKRFNASAYSDGVGKVWRIDFENPSNLMSALREVGCVHVRQDEARPPSSGSSHPVE